MKTVFHGEVVIVKIKSIPSDVKKLKTKGKSHILADSETTGNHHCVAIKEGVELYEKDGVLYLKNDVETDVFCVLQERHDTITLEPGIWEIDRAKEHDYLTGMKRNVAD